MVFSFDFVIVCENDSVVYEYSLIFGAIYKSSLEKSREIGRQTDIYADRKLPHNSLVPLEYLNCQQNHPLGHSLSQRFHEY